MSRLENAYATARSILAENGLTRVPISLPRLAKKLAISVEYVSLDRELSGMALVDGGVKRVLVNALHAPNRQRFTIAHEIGHHLLHADELEKGVHVDKGILRRDKVSAQGTDRLEVEANAFASELLMPESAIENALGDDFDLDDQTVLEALAKRFKVSVSALQYRLMRS